MKKTLKKLLGDLYMENQIITNMKKNAETDLNANIEYLRELNSKPKSPINLEKVIRTKRRINVLNNVLTALSK